MKFELETEYIELNKLLKITRVAQTGGHANIIIESGSVIRNGEVEMRKRAKLIKGDSITVEGTTIDIV
jgi:ribosome-associated protein